jgi:thioredoxin 1
MRTREVTTTGFEAVMDTPGLVLIDWWAPSCGPCLTFTEVFEASAEAHSDVLFATVNTDEERQLADALAIEQVPTLMVFRDGVLLYEKAGTLSSRSLEALIMRMQGPELDAVWRRAAATLARLKTESRSRLH